MATQTNKTEQQVILNNGIMQHLLSIPEDGLLIRLRIDGRHLAASFEEGNQPGVAPLLITQALSHLRVGTILDTDDPFEPL